MSKPKPVKIYAYRVPDNCESLFGKSRYIVKNAISNIEKTFHVGSPDALKKLLAERTGAKGEYDQIVSLKKRADYYLVGFARLDTVEGPARGNTKGEIHPFQLGEDEGFAHASAALYAPDTGAFITTSRKGAASYLDMFSMIMEFGEFGAQLSMCQPSPLIQADIDKQILNSRYCKKFDVRLCPSMLPNEYYESNTALGSIINRMGMREFDGLLSITIESKRGGNWFSKWFKWRPELSVLQGAPKDSVKTLKATVNDEGHNHKFKLLDLTDAIVSDSVDVMVGASKYIAPEALFGALEKQFNKWKNLYS